MLDTAVDSEYALAFEDYVAVDVTLAAAGEVTKEDNVNTAKTHDGSHDDEQEENIMDDEGPLPGPVTSCKVMTAINTLTWYLETIEKDQSVFKNC